LADGERLAPLKALVAGLLARAPRGLAEARLAWLQGNDGEAKRALHSLRGSVGMFGAKQFVALTVALESAIGLAS